LIQGSRDSVLGTRELVLDTRELILNPRESVLDTRESGLDTRESGLDTRESVLDTRESGLDTRELRLGTRESVLDTRESLKTVLSDGISKGCGFSSCAAPLTQVCALNFRRLRTSPKGARTRWNGPEACPERRRDDGVGEDIVDYHRMKPRVERR
jgi:hypothetical protein